MGAGACNSSGRTGPTRKPSQSIVVHKAGNSTRGELRRDRGAKGAGATRLSLFGAVVERVLVASLASF